MSPTKRYAKKHAKARHRRRLQAHERLERDRREAQRAAEALHQALEDLSLPADLVTEIEGRLCSQKKLLGKIVGVMFPTLFGCRTPSELCRVRGWDKNWPSRVLGALPKRSWLKRLRRLGLEVLVPLWRHVRLQQQGTLLVEGKRAYPFTLADGRQLTGEDLLQGEAWPWREHPWEARVRYVRLQATSPTYGAMTGRHRRGAGPGSLLSAVSGDDAECTAVDPAVATTELDRVCLSDAEASVGD